MSCAYEGWVRHRRFAPVAHEFRYPLRMQYRELAPAAREAVLDVVEARTGRRPDGPVRRLALPRGFNPVTFSYCYAGNRVAAVAAEVTNTPWGERHTYVLEGRSGAMPKALHVSPFLGVDGSYRWRLTEPGEALEVRIAYGDEFEATLSLRRGGRVPRSPLGSWAVVARIYLQALRLRLKGAPYHPHPA